MAMVVVVRVVNIGGIGYGVRGRIECGYGGGGDDGVGGGGGVLVLL